MNQDDYVKTIKLIVIGKENPRLQSSHSTRERLRSSTRERFSSSTFYPVERTAAPSGQDHAVVEQPCPVKPCFIGVRSPRPEVRGPRSEVRIGVSGYRGIGVSGYRGIGVSGYPRSVLFQKGLKGRNITARGSAPGTPRKNQSSPVRAK
jgi:hypothetical protein